MFYGFLKRIGLTMSCGLLTSLACGQTTTILSFDDALQLAVQNAPQIKANQSAIEVAHQQAMLAQQLPDPVMSIGINNLPLNGEDAFDIDNDFMTMRSLGVMQAFTRAQKRRALSMRFENTAQMQAAQNQFTLTSVKRDTAIAWLNRFYQESMRALLEKQKRQNQLQIETMQNSYASGNSNQAEILMAMSELEQIQDQLSVMDTDIQMTTNQLVRWVGNVGYQPLGRQPKMAIPKWWTGDFQSHLINHPELSVFDKQEAVAMADVEVAKANKKTDWSWSLMFSQRGAAYSDMVSLTASAPLQWDQKNRQDREVAIKRAELAQVQAQRSAAVRMHTAETESMLLQWQNNQNRLQRFDEKLIPLAQTRISAITHAYATGKSDLSAVIAAQRDEITIQINRLQLAMLNAQLWASLYYLLPDEQEASS